MSLQEDWASCSKCQGLFFAPFRGVCPAGGQHDSSNSFRYEVSYAVSPSNSMQTGWASCPRCQGMHFAGFATKGVCPAGGQHTETNSFAYAMIHDVAPARNMQDQWKSCRKCQGLFYGPFNGHCPVGGSHDAGGSFNYTLPFTAQAVVPQPIVPQSHSWTLKPGNTISAGNVTLETTKIIISSDGNWSWEGGLHDSSTLFGDNWACGFAFNQLGHGAVASGSLGATLSGPAADTGIHQSGNDPWLAANFAAAAGESIELSLHAKGDIGPLIDSLIQDLGQVADAIGEFIKLIGSAPDPEPIQDPDPGSGGDGEEIRRGRRLTPPRNVHEVPISARVTLIRDS